MGIVKMAAVLGLASAVAFIAQHSSFDLDLDLEPLPEIPTNLDDGPLTVTLHNRDDLATAITEQIARGGIFVTSGAELSMHDKTEVTLVLPAPNPPMKLAAEVVLCSENPPGYGLHIEDHHGVRAQLEAMLEALT